VFCREPFAKELDKLIFPGSQGGPLVNTIAAKAVCLKEAMEPEFRAYQQQVIANAKALARRLQENGSRIVSGGTDNHLMLVDVYAKGLTGREAELALEKAGITVNKNAIPFDTLPPLKASGIRIGTPAVTTRGMGEREMAQIADWISDVLGHRTDEARLARIREEVRAMTDRFPLYPLRWEGCDGAKMCFQPALQEAAVRKS